MQNLKLIFISLCLVAFASYSNADEPTGKIEKLIRQLGSDDYGVREKATTQLIKESEYILRKFMEYHIDGIKNLKTIKFLDHIAQE